MRGVASLPALCGASPLVSAHRIQQHLHLHLDGRHRPRAHQCRNFVQAACCHLTPPLARTSLGTHHGRSEPHQRPPCTAGHAMGVALRPLSTSAPHNGGPRDGSLVVGRHVSEALANGCPVVALESTLITHGLPEPQNLELALQLEREIAQGRWWAADDNHGGGGGLMRGCVVPATVGIVRGQPVVGLTRDELEFLARKALSRPIKASRRDIALAQAFRLSAGTTVSATMALATSCRGRQLAAGGRAAPRPQIAVFATGGLGGVHAGGELSMDVSADLYEMARSPMGLVSSGFKSFLDTRRSLELLETFGCTVASLRASEDLYVAGSVPHANRANQDDGDGGDLLEGPLERKRAQLFPGFFTSACKERVASPWQCDDVREAARLLFHCLAPPSDPFEHYLGPDNGGGGGGGGARAMLLACPIPRKFSLDQEQASGRGELDELLAQISREVDARPGVSGAQRTPLILAELSKRTGGRTLAANLELLRNNARVGAHLAYEHALLRESGGGGGPRVARAGPARSQTAHRPEPNTRSAAPEPAHAHAHAQGRPGSPIVIGCTMIDMHVRTKIDDKFKANPRHSGVTFEGEPHLALGGVGRNLAAGLELLGHAPLFVTSLANDNLGQFARAEMAKLAADAPGANCARADSLARTIVLEWAGERPGADGNGRPASSCFALVLVDALTGQCEYVLANLDAKRAISRDSLTRASAPFDLAARLATNRTPLVVLDANLPGPTLDCVLELCHGQRVPVFLEPTDVACLRALVGTICEIAREPERAGRLESLAFLSPNVLELCELVRLFRRAPGNEDDGHGAQTGSWPAIALDGQPGEALVQQMEPLVRELMTEHLPHLGCLLVTMDKRGLLVAVRRAPGQIIGQAKLLEDFQWTSPQDTTATATATSTRQLELKYYPPLEVVHDAVSGSGAGDCFASGFISGLLEGRTLDACITRAFEASLCALRDQNTVPQSLRELSRHVRATIEVDQ